VKQSDPNDGHLKRRDETRAVRAQAWRFILELYAKKKGGSATAPDDVRKDQDAHTAKSILPQQPR
jgi:hypothetical protein